MTKHSKGQFEGPSEHYLLARGLIKPSSLARPAKASRTSPTRATLVYFVKAVTLGHIKIGKADCVHTRFRTLRTNNADTLLLLGAILTEDGTALERRLHHHFKADRLHGEWFRASPALVAYIAENASTPPPMRDWRLTRHGG